MTSSTSRRTPRHGHTLSITLSPYVACLQAFFHFRTLVPAEGGAVGSEGERSVVDDSRTLGTGPFELLVGRKFKLGVWEDMVKTMKIGEIAEFICPFKVSSTPFSRHL